MIQDDLILAVLTLGLAGLIGCLYYIQVLRSEMKRIVYYDLDYDPGPLDDAALRVALCSPILRASKTLDRVQDAFDRLVKEKSPISSTTNIVYFMDE